MPKTDYQPPRGAMLDPLLCHMCNKHPFVPGLTLPNGMKVCQECFNRHAETTKQKSPKKSKKTPN